MAFRRVLFLLSLIAVLLPDIITAIEFIVGDDGGWESGIDYGDWVAGKVFQVGDTLVFKYTPGNGSVCEVNSTAYENCDTPPAEEAKTTGNDVFELNSLGKKYFISGVKEQCEDGGQKVYVTVVEQPQAPPVTLTPAPSPESPLPSHRKVSFFKKLVESLPFFH